MPVRLRRQRNRGEQQQRRYNHPGQNSDNNCARLARVRFLGRRATKRVVPAPARTAEALETEHILDAADQTNLRQPVFDPPVPVPIAIQRGMLLILGIRGLRRVRVGRGVEVRAKDDERDRDRALAGLVQRVLDRRDVHVQRVLERPDERNDEARERGPQRHGHELVERRPRMPHFALRSAPQALPARRSGQRDLAPARRGELVLALVLVRGYVRRGDSGQLGREQRWRVRERVEDARALARRAGPGHARRRRRRHEDRRRAAPLRAHGDGVEHLGRVRGREV